MAINKKLIHFQKLATFKELLAANNILDTSIVFIKDALLMWTHGLYYALPEVAISNGVIPSNNEDLWIDTSENSESNLDVFVGNSEPSTSYKLWVDSVNEELKYYNGTKWVVLSGVAEETLILTLSANDLVSGLIGANITITYEGYLKTATWQGDSINFAIPSGVTYTITVSDIEKYETPESRTFTAVAKETRLITMNYVYKPAIDLSKVDIYGNKRTSATTANCYVVKAANIYRIPLVYGNAIVDGATNATSYTKNSGSYSMNFVNYKGALITSPFIEKDTSEVVSSAQLSIADTDGIFTNIKVVSGGTNTDSISNCGYIRFTIASVPITGANGVISIKNSSGTIMWNWHIWVWKDDLTPVTITNNTSKTYQVLPVNLASKWDSSSSTPTKIKNWFYQWGRPTPMLCPTAYNSDSNAMSYGVLSYTKVNNNSGSYQLGIKNPTTFYGYGNNNNGTWYGSSGSHYNLWDLACTSTGYSDNNVVKTVYDPCPPGFKMPNGNTFTSFSTISGTWGGNGYTWLGVYFPASGYRNYSSGSLVSVGSNGYVWSAAADSQYDACSLYFDSGSVYPQYCDRRAYGFSVRPVAEY